MKAESLREYVGLVKINYKFSLQGIIAAQEII